MTSSKKLPSPVDINSDNLGKKASVNPEIRYEQAVAELEIIINQMELGDLPLEDSFNAYKRGAELVQICQTALNHVDQQVQILTAANKLAAFNPDEA